MNLNGYPLVRLIAKLIVHLNTILRSTHPVRLRPNLVDLALGLTGAG